MNHIRLIFLFTGFCRKRGGKKIADLKLAESRHESYFIVAYCSNINILTSFQKRYKYVFYLYALLSLKRLRLFQNNEN